MESQSDLLGCGLIVDLACSYVAGARSHHAMIVSIASSGRSDKQARLPEAVYAGPRQSSSQERRSSDMRHLAHAAPQRRNAPAQRVCERTYLVIQRTCCNTRSSGWSRVAHDAGAGSQCQCGGMRSRLTEEVSGPGCSGDHSRYRRQQRFTMFSSINCLTHHDRLRDGVRRELKAGDDAVVVSGAAKRPEQVRWVDSSQRTVSPSARTTSADIRLSVSYPAGGSGTGCHRPCQAGDAGMRDHAGWNRAPQVCGGTLDLTPTVSAPTCTFSRGHCPNPDVAQPAKVDRQRTVLDRVSSDVVPTSTGGEGETEFGRPCDGVANILVRRAADDRAGTLVNRGVPHSAAVLVAQITGTAGIGHEREDRNIARTRVLHGLHARSRPESTARLRGRALGKAAADLVCRCAATAKGGRVGCRCRSRERPHSARSRASRRTSHRKHERNQAKRIASDDWYVEMREIAPMRTSGFGMGSERFLLWLLQHDDIRDLQLLCREPGHESCRRLRTRPTCRPCQTGSLRYCDPPSRARSFCPVICATSTAASVERRD